VSTPAYTQLEDRFRRIGALDDALHVLGWDMQVNMPPGGAEARAEQQTAMRLTIREKVTDPAVGELLAAAEADKGLDDWQRANLREMRRRLVHATAIPPDLLEATTRAISKCHMVWREARPKSDFALIKEPLARVVALVREGAAARAAATGLSPYEALMDIYEPGARTARIDTIFDQLARELPPLVDEVLARQAAGSGPLVPGGPFPVEAQRKVGERFMRVLGFDFDHGRLDATLHPFCSGVPEDMRVTSRWDETGFFDGLMAVLHETGHALYEMGRPAAWRHQPVGHARGMVMHESQSLLMEMQACRSREFLSFAAPILAQAFGGSGPAWQPDNVYRLYTRVARSLIRVDADEVTYPLHVILRYRLERAMLAGDLPVADLPGAFRDGMRGLVGVAPPDDKDGCLQDIHWYSGSIGYFPTYTLGAAAAAQLFAAARKARPEIPDALAKGDFAPLLGWLRENVHGKASSKLTDEILADATGSPLDTKAFMAHLRARYLAN
jgi:carboxypeptidase Taq